MSRELGYGSSGRGLIALKLLVYLYFAGVVARLPIGGANHIKRKQDIKCIPRVIPEQLALLETELLEDESLEMVSPSDVDTATGTGSVSVVPTFVRPQREKVQEVCSFCSFWT